MKSLHIAPGDSAGGALHAAIKEAGHDDDVLRFLDDLSCGPINSENSASRAKWWSSFSYDETESEQALREFWHRVDTTNDRLIVWFGRHSASELAFFHSFAERLGPRPYEIIDVTGFRFPFVCRDGSQALSIPMPAVGTISVKGLRQLFGSERPVSDDMRASYAEHWRRLKAENAHFRVVTNSGLASAPVEHFDHLILERVTDRWTDVFRIIGETIGYNSDPIFKPATSCCFRGSLRWSIRAKLLADGNVSDPRNCRIRLPG